MTAPKLSIWDQALINLAGWLACSRYPDPNREMILDQVRRLVPFVTHDHPLIGALAEAAQAVVDHSHHPSSMELLSARGAMEAALAAVFLARGSQARAQIWPDENPAPGNDPGTQTPAATESPHAAE